MAGNMGVICVGCNHSRGPARGVGIWGSGAISRDYTFFNIRDFFLKKYCLITCV